MDADKMLELVSVQRHDFLNHLQVISGLLQLKKEEQAREYIIKTGQEIKRLSKISHLKDAEAAVAFLIGHNQAVNAQIKVNYEVQADLAECDVPGAITGTIIGQLLDYVIIHLTPPEVTERVLTITIKTLEGGYQCSISFAGSVVVNEVTWSELTKVIRPKLAPYGGKLEKSAAGLNQNIKLFLPAVNA